MGTETKMQYKLKNKRCGRVMKKEYEEPIINFNKIVQTDCLKASKDNWQEDFRTDGWDDWN